MTANRRNKRRGWLLFSAVALVVAGWAMYDRTWGTARQWQAGEHARERSEQQSFDQRVAARMAIEKHLCATLKDPASLNVIEWGQLTTHADGTQSMPVRYRATNSFGAYMTEHQRFRLSSSAAVLDVIDLSQ